MRRTRSPLLPLGGGGTHAGRPAPAARGRRDLVSPVVPVAPIAPPSSSAPVAPVATAALLPVLETGHRGEAQVARECRSLEEDDLARLAPTRSTAIVSAK